MFRSLVAVLLSLTTFVSAGQVLEPAKITASISKKDLKVGDEVDVIFKATIDEGWYMYTNEFDEDCGPIPISITVSKNSGFELVGTLKAIDHHKKHDVFFDCDVNIFEKTGEFRQTIKILSPSVKLGGEYKGQVCSEGSCVLFDGDFAITGFKVGGDAIVTNPDTQQTDPVVEEPKSVFKGFEGPRLDKTILDGTPMIDNESFIGFLVLAFVLGLTSLITPCVFPMIPMTVTFFLREGQSRRAGIRKAIIFGLSIIVIYTLAGTLVAFSLGSDGLNALSTHWAPNLFVFAIFIVFALSFFGLFEINAPYKLVNKADQQADKGGLTGIFFMAATLVLVSFSCTIPIVGNVLVLAASGQVMKPILAMFSYSLAFAIPFTLFAFFPELIKALPKSGGWLNSVKVTLGFLELALCLKFFSIADQAYHWGLLDRDLNIALWIVTFSLLGIYFLGKLPLKGDTAATIITVPRLMLALATFTFVVYLTPGLWGAPLKALAGYLPPMYTHDFNLAALKGEDSPCGPAKYADFLHLPHGINGYFDYEQALACAREQHKPLFIDFTGHGCTNCREMEAVVWSDPQVLQRFNNDFIVVALYVDDKTELPEADWYTSKVDGKVKKTIGKQNADLQIANLDNNAQPFYILLGDDERVLAWPRAYDRDINGFVGFLDSGKKKYKELFN
ncbi:MAG TPA: cytochrome c biogenesis protein CcdA [Cyclobacteriaceae bacterium]|nr:cytochrome c biogenesis protein CcdA [Cyclobacteriaceae bacterium]